MVLKYFLSNLLKGNYVLTLSNGLKALEDLIGTLSEDTDFNEAQTRFKIIDSVLFQCLGWEREEVNVESQEHRKFTDYELGKPRLAILEAKREGVYFDIPAGLSKKLVSDIPSIVKLSQEASKAISQVQEYCSQRGVPIAIVSNGHQYIIFLASRQDGTSVLDGKALVFKSLEHLKEKFDLAWQLISSEGIKERRIFGYLTTDSSSIPNKLSSKLIDYPKVRYASEMQSSLRQLSELFLQDVIENPELEGKFFSECYCESGALSKYSLLSKNILEARYASLFSKQEPFPHTQPVKSKKTDNFSPDILAESIARRPIVLLGDVGVGKTSFVKNLIYNSAHEEFKNAIYIYIDLGSKAALADDLKLFVLNEISRQVLDKYDIDINEYYFIKGVYASEICRFSKGIWGKKQESEPDIYETKLLEMLDALTQQFDQHVKRSINKYSQSSQRQIIISLDNADQRDFEIQQSAFIIGQELAKDWRATVFVSVRPQTFFKSKRSGALTAYPHKVFTISPPRIDMVIKKRLQFALNMAEGNMPITTMNYLRINSDSLVQFIKALLTSLSENPDLYEFLSNITGGNIRAAIEFVTGFIGSPNVDAEKIINIMKEDGKYRIPIHEFTKSALLGDYSHYNPNTSIAMNAFDVSSTDSNEHFLVPILISFLESKDLGKDKDGFLTTVLIFDELQSCGFTSEQISCALRRTTNKKLIETSQRITFEEDSNGTLIGEMPSSFRITTVGAYHLHRWLGQFTYLDAMVFDTPIFDKSIRSDIIDALNSLGISDRFDRAVAFKKYLLACWNQFSYKPIYFDFSEVIDSGLSSFETVNRAVENNKINFNHRN